MTITLQPHRPNQDDPRVSLPYPFHIATDGRIGRQDFWGR
jgi:hypothetical protein